MCLTCGHFRGGRPGRSIPQFGGGRPAYSSYRLVDILWSPRDSAPVLAQTVSWKITLFLLLVESACLPLIVFIIPERVYQQHGALVTGSLYGDFGLGVLRTLVVATIYYLPFAVFARGIGSHGRVSQIFKASVFGQIPLLAIGVFAVAAIAINHPVCRSFLRSVGVTGILLYSLGMFPILIWCCVLSYKCVRSVTGFSHLKMIILHLATSFTFCLLYVPLAFFTSLTAAVSTQDVYDLEKEDQDWDRRTTWRSI